MFKMRVAVLVMLQIVFLNASVGATVSTPSNAVLSFKEWKNDKSAQARARYLQLETEYISKKAANPKDMNLKSLYNSLKNTKSRIDDVNELTVSDYFVGYLSDFKDQKKAFTEAATKLDAAEVAALMETYAESLLKTSGEGISTSRPGSASEASK